MIFRASLQNAVSHWWNRSHCPFLPPAGRETKRSKNLSLQALDDSQLMYEILGQIEGEDPDEASIKGYLITDYHGLSKNTKRRFISHILEVQGEDTSIWSSDKLLSSSYSSRGKGWKFSPP